MTLNSTSAGRCLDIPPYGYQCIWWNTGGFVAGNDTYNESGYILFHVTVINIFCSFFSTDGSDVGMPSMEHWVEKLD